jgi:hypothetical protein
MRPLHFVILRKRRAVGELTLEGVGVVAASEDSRYSYRKATIGSTLVARCAGK